MSTPTDPSLDELRALQRRAYGPDADIDGDPVAVARLRHLEAELSAARAPVAEPETAGDQSETDAAPPRDPHAEADAEPAPEHPSRYGSSMADAAHRDGPDADPGDAVAEPGPRVADESRDASGLGPAAPPAPKWWRRRIPLLWAGSVVVALILGIGLTLLVQSLDAGRIGVLQEDGDADWPAQVFGSRPEGGRQFEEFHGLTVISFPQGFGAGAEQTCLYVLTSPDGSGFGGGSCAAGSFPATASMLVDGTAPKELRDRFAEGTALQFVLEETAVHVYAREPGIGESSGSDGGEGRS